MLARLAALTWKRPKLVLALVGVCVVVAGGLGYDVEDHLKAAGFTDSASQSERATAVLRGALGYDASPAIVVLVRDPGGGRLDVTSPAVRAEVDRISRALTDTRYVGHVVNPLRDRREGRDLIEPDAARSSSPPGCRRRTSRATAASPPRMPRSGSARARSTCAWAASPSASTRSTTRPARTSRGPR